MAKEETRLAIIKEGARLIHAKGYNNTGLTDILTSAGVPKGSFYFYFKSKDDFGLAVIDYYWSFIEGMAQSYLERNGTPLQRLERFIDAYEDLFKKMELSCGCPIGNLMQEMSDLSEAFRQKVGDIYSRMEDAIEKCIEEAKESGEIHADLDSAQTAQFILNSWEGAIMHMKLAKSSEPLKIFKRMIFDHILR